MTTDASPDVAVIVAFRNAERHLADAFRSLAAQRHACSWEVVAVDNGSTDGSRRIAETFAHELPLRFVNAPERANVAYARNTGVAATGAEKLLFVDADDEVDSRYLAAMAVALDRYPFVTSLVDSISLNAEWVRAAHGPAWQADEVGLFFGFLRAAGSNVGVRRDLFKRLGGFRESCLKSEDIAFSWDAQLRGRATIHLVRDAIYRYRYRDSVRRLWRQSFDWGRGTVRLYRDFAVDGMPPRTPREAMREWLETARCGRSLFADRGSRAAFAVRLGFCLGRATESVRSRTWYF